MVALTMTKIESRQTTRSNKQLMATLDDKVYIVLQCSMQPRTSDALLPLHSCAACSKRLTEAEAVTDAADRKVPLKAAMS